jgi:hypothetical protein
LHGSVYFNGGGVIAAHGVNGDLDHFRRDSATLPLLQALRGLYSGRNEDRRDAASAVRGSSSTQKKILSSNRRERVADWCGPWNVVVLD